jgi:hypothetical protein
LNRSLCWSLPLSHSFQMARLLPTLLWAVFLLTGANAQFQFFEQMFNGGQQQHHHQTPQNVPSDSNWYQENYNNGISTSPSRTSPSVLVVSMHLHPASKQKPKLTMSIAHCTNYLCPDTLACVHFPHHCPCPHPVYEEKFELGDGKAICVNKGGFKAGEAARKVELARKGLL